MIRGIYVDALDFWPGVHSRRWYGNEKDDTGRNEKLLELMKDEDNRTVYLISRFALVDREKNILFTDVVRNEFILAKTQIGSNGFGYDKILVPGTTMRVDACTRDLKKVTDLEDKYKFFENSVTIGNLTQEEKNFITFRGRIAKRIATYLKESK